MRSTSFFAHKTGIFECCYHLVDWSVFVDSQDSKMTTMLPSCAGTMVVIGHQRQQQQSSQITDSRLIGSTSYLVVLGSDSVMLFLDDLRESPRNAAPSPVSGRVDALIYQSSQSPLIAYTRAAGMLGTHTFLRVVIFVHMISCLGLPKKGLQPISTLSI